MKRTRDEKKGGGGEKKEEKEDKDVASVSKAIAVL